LRDRTLSALGEIAHWLAGRANAQQTRDPLERKYFDYLYRLGPVTARAFRLVGAADEFFSPGSLTVEVDLTPYKLPKEWRQQRDHVLSSLARRAAETGALHFDGPHTRLIDYEIRIPDVSTEAKHLVLRFGPVQWFDYSIVRWFTDELLARKDYKTLNRYISFDAVAVDGQVKQIHLHNLVDTVTTIITSDGHVFWSARGKRVAVAQGLFSSAVAENIHQEKDRSLDPAANATLPSPFRTVVRGLEEELSPSIAAYVEANPHSVRLLGISFDLGAFHPDLLFLVLIPFSRAELLRVCHEQKGKDFIEGNLKSAALNRGFDELFHHLRTGRWTGAGMASVIRALEYVRVARPDLLNQRASAGTGDD
jgi:hypothetical protein